MNVIAKLLAVIDPPVSFIAYALLLPSELAVDRLTVCPAAFNAALIAMPVPAAVLVLVIPTVPFALNPSLKVTVLPCNVNAPTVVLPEVAVVIAPPVVTSTD